MQSNSLSQHISHTTRNTDKSKSLLDLALTNCKFICQAGTLDHYISDHQPIYLIHRKSKDKRKSVKFEGRSYRSFDENVFGAPLKELRIFFMKLRVLREPESVKFEGRSYRSFDENVFGALYFYFYFSNTKCIYFVSYLLGIYIFTFTCTFISITKGQQLLMLVCNQYVNRAGSSIHFYYGGP